MSYARLFLDYPEVLARIRTEYGAGVYTDDNEVVDPAIDSEEMSSTVAVVNVIQGRVRISPVDTEAHPLIWMDL